MPKSSTRKKAVYTPPQKSQKAPVSPRWLVPAMLTCWLVGLVWIAAYYMTAGNAPLLEDLQDWNLLIGFGLIIAGVILATRWR